MPEGIGNVIIEITDPDTGKPANFELQNVYYMPDSPVNLISGIKLMEKGYHYDAIAQAIRFSTNPEKLAGITFNGEAFILDTSPNYTKKLAEAMRVLQLTTPSTGKGQHS